MRASAIEFRLRMAIIALVITMGFWSPWIETWGVGRRISLLEWLALELSRTGLVGFSVATPAVIVTGALVAALGAGLRIWGTAYLGAEVVNHMQMQAGAVVAGGPYRFVRNPLYLGSGFTFLATCFIMPATGALLVIVLLAVFLFRLILAEEAFLTRQMGEPYQAYLRAVPRLFPRRRANLPPATLHPDWIRALLAELYPVGVLVTLAIVAWRYENWLMVKAIIVSFGVSLVARALLPQTARAD
jgi:protein-S-isoprenylcysteine O-methyltransferase Ste14